MRKRILVLILFVTALTVAGCMRGDGGEIVPRDLYITVMLAEGEGYTITSPNPQKVAPGEDAVFGVNVDPEYIIESTSSGAAFEDGVIRLENVSYPTTVNINSRRRKQVTLQTMYDARSGTLKWNQASKTVLEGTEVTLTALPKSGSMFLGYSVGGYIKEGGTTVCYTTDYTFTATENVRIYVNYAQENSKVLIYKANGGAVPNSSNDSIFIEIVNSAYLCPNTLYDGGNFIRDGYVLYGYNTEPDGSGRFYGLGWNVVMSNSPIQTLYAQWFQETDASDFDFKVGAGSVTITGYRGSGDIVVIPQYYQGIPVTGIANNAFSGCRFETMVFSKNLKNVDDNAINDCPNFTTLYMSDSVLKITDLFVMKSPNFSKLIMNAVGPPRYMTSRNGTYHIKFERLMTAPGKKLVITSGSNSAYGIISEQLMAGLNNEYSVVNYGCNASTSAPFYIEVASNFINPGDILVHAPEYSNYQYGYNEINVTLWQIFEGAYDAFSCVDIRKYIRTFTSFSEFNIARQSKTPQTYEQFSSETVNIYGDYIKEKVGYNNYTPPAPGKGTTSLNTSLHTSAYVANLNRALDLVAAAGGKCYLSFAVMNYDAATTSAQSDATQTTFAASAARYIHATVISDPGDYMLDTKYFYNSNYHPTTEGARVRTDILIRDIKTQLAKEK